MSNSLKIMLKMPNWLGDSVMATPLFKDLKSHFPTSHLTVLCQTNIAPLLLKDPYINEIVSYEKKKNLVSQLEHSKIISYLKLNAYDLGILLTNSFSSAWWFWRGAIKKVIGFTGFRSILLTKQVLYPKNLEKEHLVTTYKRLLTPLGIALSQTKPSLYLDEIDTAFSQNFLKNQGISSQEFIIGINPGASYGSAKCWLEERFKDLSKKLLEFPQIKIIYFGDSTSSKLIENICKDFPSRVINLANKTSLRELMALIKVCHLFLSNDSGPMHIAAALETPLVALFGSTNPIKTGPFSKGDVIYKEVSCSPCYKRTCPIDFRCMKQISVEDVYQVIKPYLNKII